MTELVASIETLRDKIVQLYRIGQGMATPDRGVRMTIEPFEETRTNEQNDKMWAMLTDVSRQVPWVLNGKEQKLTPEQWKDIFTAALVQETNIAPGINGGFVMLGRRTSRMRKKQFVELIELIYAFGADKSVVWSDPEDVEQLRGVA